MKRFILASIGSSALRAEVEPGRIDLAMMCANPTPGAMKHIGLTVHTADLTNFITQVRAAIKEAKRK